VGAHMQSRRDRHFQLRLHRPLCRNPEPLAEHRQWSTRRL
ncbi:MAG: hypothetical protein AVDCRST_MAG10-2599, partial [uncultured Acidimicrobiales bacterium]